MFTRGVSLSQGEGWAHPIGVASRSEVKCGSPCEHTVLGWDIGLKRVEEMAVHPSVARAVRGTFVQAFLLPMFATFLHNGASESEDASDTVSAAGHFVRGGAWRTGGGPAGILGGRPQGMLVL